jgi:hypothetical protein
MIRATLVASHVCAEQPRPQSRPGLYFNLSGFYAGIPLISILSYAEECIGARRQLKYSYFIDVWHRSKYSATARCRAGRLDAS